MTVTDKQLLEIYDLMVKSRVLELTLIQMVKNNDGYFWIGGAGEEAFYVPFGLQVNKGEGLDHDYLHLHYRNTGLIMALGLKPIDSVRMMRNTTTDPYTGGRAFIHHYACKKYNIPPATSTVETQFSIAPGTALAQKRANSKGITIVTGGEAGTAEADFSSSLIWSTMPDIELPMLIVLIDNKYGVSTLSSKIFGFKEMEERVKPFKIPFNTVDGNDVIASIDGIVKAFQYVREEKKPYFLCAHASRLFGHSSSSGANKENETDCIEKFKSELIKRSILNEKEAEMIFEKYQTAITIDLDKVRKEPMPLPESIYDHVYTPSDVDKVFGKRYFNPNKSFNSKEGVTT